MKKTSIKLTIDWEQDFYIEKALKDAITRKWEQTLIMHDRESFWFITYGKYFGEGHYWEESIDTYADLLLQIREQMK